MSFVAGKAKRASDKEPGTELLAHGAFWITNGTGDQRRDISKNHREPGVPFLLSIMLCYIERCWATYERSPLGDE